MNKTNIIGEYELNIHIPTMFNNYTATVLKKHNLITNLGIDYFLNRWISNDTELIKNIVVGTGTTLPTKEDTSLSGYLNSATPSLTVDNTNNRIILKSTFSSNKINGTTEIGVTTSNGILISRDVHDAIDIPVTSTFTVTYTYTLSIESVKSTWSKRNLYTYTYLTKELTPVVGVIEEDTNSGYTQVIGSEQVEAVESSYFYDTEHNILYIHTSDNKKPSNHTISIKYTGER